MARGIVYVMSCTQGLYKIGKTDTSQFENRMAALEANGYRNFNGLKREFAVEVEDYHDKERLIHRLFDKSQVKIDGKGIEMFAVELKLVIDLLKAFDGKQIFPPSPTLAVPPVHSKVDLPPDGMYTLSHNRKDFGKIAGTMRVENGKCIVLKGSFFAPWKDTNHEFPVRKMAKVENHHLIDDFICNSVSIAASVCVGRCCNGWEEWKDASGEAISKFHHKKNKK